MIVILKEWPYGVRCMDCMTPLVEGDPYIQRMEGFAEDTPTTEVVCLTCGGGVPSRATPLP
jgi:RNase P subunit RPR2